MNNRYKLVSNLLLLSVVIFYASSCIDARKSTYFNNVKDESLNTSKLDTVVPVIQKNDILSVTITSLNMEASAIFNTSNNIASSTVTSSSNTQSGTGYLVNSDGFIQLPILGNVLVAGLTSNEVMESIKGILLDKKLLIDPVVTIHILNYEVTVLGEVAKPTVINVPNEKISLLKALGLAGDITIFGKKDNVLLIRESGGKRKVKRINLNDANFLNSPFYYLQPNDIVYVETSKNKIANSDNFRQTIPIILSGISIILLTLDRIIK